jgi:hypothetical protein
MVEGSQQISETAAFFAGWKKWKSAAFKVTKMEHGRHTVAILLLQYRNPLNEPVRLENRTDKFEDVAWAGRELDSMPKPTEIKTL